MKKIMLGVLVFFLLGGTAVAERKYVNIEEVELSSLAGSYYILVNEGPSSSVIYHIGPSSAYDISERPSRGSATIKDSFSEGQHTWTITPTYERTVFNIYRIVNCNDHYWRDRVELCRKSR